MEEYTVILFIDLVKNNNHEIVKMKQTIRLPFVPHEKMDLTVGKTKVRIISVSYDTNYSVFKAIMYDDYTETQAKHKIDKFDELVWIYKKNGWEKY